MMNDDRTSRLAPNVLSTLGRVRSLLRKYVLARSLLMVAMWVLIVFWLGALVDYLPVTAGSNETPRWVRIGMLCLMGLGGVWALLIWGLPRFLTRISSPSIAVLIERHFPSLNNELITAVEFSEAKTGADEEVSNPQAHRDMLARVHRSLAERVAVVEPAELFNWQPIWGLAVAVALGSIVTVVTAVGMPDWIGLWAKRLFALSDQPWPRRALLRADGIQIQLPAFTGQFAPERSLLPFVDGVAHVSAGSAAMLQISAAAAPQEVPEVCTLFYQSSDGGRGRANLRRIGSPKDGWQQFALDGPPLDGISAAMHLDVLGLDARLRDLQLEVIAPAVITEMRLECKYPKYLLDSLSTRPASERLAYRSGIQIPQGTLVTLVGQSSTELSAAQFVVRSSNSNTESETPFAIENALSEGNEFQIPLGLLDANQVVEVRLLDLHGLSSEQIPRYVLTVQEDTPPEVSSRLAGIGNAVTPVARLPIRGSVADDHGVASVLAEIASGSNASARLPVALSDEGEIDSEIDLQQLADSGRFSVAPGDTIGLVVTAQDYFDLGDEVHIGRGQPQQLSVVTVDELLVILDRRELELRQRLELILSELEQLRDVLQLLASGLEMQASLRPRVSAGTAFGLGLTRLQPDEETPDEQAQQQRMRVFRAQQSVLQGDKSEQELRGVASHVDNVRQQLQNNRIDSYDRQTRLADKVYTPLVTLLDTDYVQFAKDLSELQTATMSGDGRRQAQKAVGTLDQVLVELLSIKESMLDIESFNEIIDLVRSLLEDQDLLIEQTEKAQRDKFLQLLQ